MNNVAVLAMFVTCLLVLDLVIGLVWGVGAAFDEVL